MRQNFAQKTFEVFVAEDNRWLIDSHHEVRSKALERAEELVAEKRFEGVRVVAESQRTGEEEVVFEELLDVGEKQLKIVPIEDAPVCGEIGDYYAFPARQAASRLLRELLEERGQTALELAFDYGALKLLERNDSLFPQAMQRVGAIQARQTGATPTARVDALYAAFEQIKETARLTGEDGLRLGFLERLDLKGLVGKAPRDDPAQTRIYVLGGLALALSKRGDWPDKLALLCELAQSAPDDLVQEYLDEIAAEILDGNTAVNDLFGGFGDTVSAFQALIHLTQGRCRIVNSRSCLEAFNALMASRPMPLTSSLLLSRVARSLDGIRPLTRDGKDAERTAFKGLIRELISDAGLLGGPRMAAAVTGRARIVFADPDDLTVADAMGQMLGLMPNRAVRLGYLLDMAVASQGQKHENVVLDALARLVPQLTSLSSLLPKETPSEKQASILDELRQRMQSDALPEKWRSLFSSTLDRLQARGSNDDAEGTGVIFKMEDAAVTTKKEMERLEAKAGEVLFEEGETADNAYLIVDGNIEVYRRAGNDEIVLATLGRGDILGEMSLIDNQPRMASARVVGDTKLTVITQKDLAARLGKLSENDKVLRRLIDVFVDRLRGQARLHE